MEVNLIKNGHIELKNEKHWQKSRKCEKKWEVEMSSGQLTPF